MRIGVISDIHANLVALEAVFDDMPAVDLIVCAGDVVGYNPWPKACVEAVQDRDIPTVQGNHDRMVVGEGNFLGNDMASAGVDHARRELADDQRRWLAALPVERWVVDGRLHVVHGHPQNPDRYTYPDEFTPALLGDAEALVMGHTHVQGHEVFPDGVVLNPGSIGQPRDGDPRAAYAVLDLDEPAVEPRRVAYDIDAVRDAIATAGLPERTGNRLREGR